MQTQASAISGAVLRHPTSRELLAMQGEAEVSFYATDPGTTFPYRGRIDFLPDIVPGQRSVIVDLKTADDPTPGSPRSGFGKAVADFDYAMQAALYTDAVQDLRGDVEPPRFLFVVVGKNPPHQVGVYELYDRTLQAGRAKVREAMRRHAFAESTGRYEGIPNDISTLSAPHWYQADAAPYMGI